MTIFYTSILITSLVTVIFAVAGIRMLYIARKTPNQRFSYRTKNTKTTSLLWEAANHYGGKTALISAATLFTNGYFFSLVLVDHSIILYIILFFIILEIFLFFYFVEKHIKLIIKQMKRTSYL